MASDHDGRRASKRLRSASIDSTESVLRAVSVAGRQVSSCIEWGMPQKICCSGCTQFSDRLGLLIDDRDHDAAMADAPATRHTTHSHRDTTCLRLWQKAESTLTNRERKRLKTVQCDFIRERGFNPDRLVLVGNPITPALNRRLLPTLATPQVQPQDAISPDTQTTQPTPPTPPTPDPECSPAKKQRRTNFTEYNITSNGQPYHLVIPNSHSLVTANYLSRLQNQNVRFLSMKMSFTKKKFVTDADPLTRSLLTTALASTPALATKAAAYAIPLIVGAFLNQHELLPDLDSYTYTRAFPSETYLRGLMIDQAAENIVSLGQELKGKKVYISCDKGMYHSRSDILNS